MRRYIMNYPDGLWDEIEAYRVIQGLKTTADAIRVLVEGGLTGGVVKSLSQPEAVVLDGAKLYGGRVETTGYAQVVEGPPSRTTGKWKDVWERADVAPDPAPAANIQLGPQPVTPGARLKTKGKK